MRERIKKKRKALIGDPRCKIFEFESTDDWTANKFLTLIKIMYIPVVESEIVMPHVGNSTIKFITTPNKRIQIEYIFRRYIQLEKWHLLDLSSYQRNQYKMMEDHYAIY